MGTCTSLPSHSPDAVRAMSPQQRRFSDVQMMTAAGGGGQTDAQMVDPQTRKERIAGSVIMLEPPLLSHPNDDGSTADRAHVYAAASPPRKRSLSSGARCGVRRTASDPRATTALAASNIAAATASSSTKPSPTHAPVHAHTHAALAVTVATANSSATSSAAPSRPTSAQTARAIHGAPSTNATAAAVAPVSHTAFATAAAILAVKDGRSSSGKKKKGGSTKKKPKSSLQLLQQSQAHSKSAYQSRAASPVPDAAPTARTPPPASSAAAASVEGDADLDDSRPVLRRQQSLEDEEDEKTARSLRNFEAEHVLAEQAAHICTMQLLQREAAASASGHASRQGSPHDSRSPSASNNNSPRPHAHLRSLLYGASMAPLHAQAVAATPGGATPSGAASHHHHHLHLFPTPSPTSATGSAVVSPAHTPRPDGSTPRSRGGGSATATTAAASTSSTVSSCTAPYANAEILDSSAVIFTPTGKRTALALLMSGNNSARTSPRGPSGRGGNLFGVPALSISLGGARSAHAGAHHLAHGGGAHFNFSKTVPNSPRSLSPVGGGQRSGAHTPRLGLGQGGVMSMHGSTGTGPTSPSKPNGEGNNGAPRLLAVPGGLNSPRGSSGGSASGNSSAAGSGSRQLRSHLARLAPRRFGTGTAAGGALYPQPATLPVYSHSVQTSPRRRSRELHPAGGFPVGARAEDEEPHSPHAPAHGAAALSGAPGGSLHMNGVGVGVASVENDLFERRPVPNSRTLIHRRANTAANGAGTGAPQGQGQGLGIVTSGAGVNAAGAGAASQPVSASYKRFAARLKTGSAAAKQVEQAWTHEVPAAAATTGAAPHPHASGNGHGHNHPRIGIVTGGHRIVVGEAASAGPLSSAAAMMRRRNSKP